jgi:hypothetical protein
MHGANLTCDLLDGLGLLPVLWTLGLGCRSLCFERHWAEIPQF